MMCSKPYRLRATVEIGGVARQLDGAPHEPYDSDDDQHLQEGAARFRDVKSRALEDGSQLREEVARFRDAEAAYERHTSDAQGERQPVDDSPSLGVFEGFKAAFVVFVLLLAAVVVMVKSCATAQAQTNPANLLVRACTTTPATTGFSACPQSVWAAPSATLVLDVQRNSVDMWLTAAQLQNGDHVFACEVATIAPGPFASCPSTLPGQTNNYLLASSINFNPGASTTTPPPTTNGVLSIAWGVPPVDSLGNPITQPLSYQVFVRENDCAVGSTTAACQPTYYNGTGPQGLSTPIVDTTANAARLSLSPGNWCATVAAYFTGSPQTLGPLPTAPNVTEICGTVALGVVTPGQVPGLKAGS